MRSITDWYFCCIYSLSAHCPPSCRAVWKLQLFLYSPHNSILVPFTFKEVGAQVGRICSDLYLNNSCCDICHFSRDMHSFSGLKTSSPKLLAKKPNCDGLHQDPHCDSAQSTASASPREWPPLGRVSFLLPMPAVSPHAHIIS